MRGLASPRRWRPRRGGGATAGSLDQGRSIAFDGREIEDVHSDPAFESLREFVPYQALMRTD